ncbi:type I restriction enzyme, S subunit [Humidesulfovibrio mexicanus]|uniref:Type I restriction enzyme, S subunit n=1 Tax=Humidesulfovibrio mexicanus TaxID=147047 RepID=A0A239B5W3_9BACT|nr:restriction endonuclease subunit S [Humidesulfovibrio mexicanus]SNS03042.1 type I restriction enzyme, S subunit [Humidesulfovibrio mexicanus]
MELKLGYKRTEVGVIPEEWEVTSLNTLAMIRTGIAKNSKVVPANPVQVHYLRVANVQDGYLDLSDMAKLTVSQEDIRHYAVLPGDVLMNEGGDLDKLGRGTLWSGELTPCVHQNHVFVVRCGENLIPHFLNCWTGSTQARRYFLLAGRQTTNLASINKTSLGQLPVPRPPLPEQRAIAAALSDVDALLAKLDQLLAKKRDLKQAAMQQLLTGKRRLPGFSGEWPRRSMNALGSTYGGLAGKTKADFGHGTARYIPFINIMTNTVINPLWFEPVNILATEVQNQALEGDLFFNGSSETPEEVGFCSVLIDEVPSLFLNSFCFGFRFHPGVKANGLFFAYWFRSSEGRKAMAILAQGATRYNIAKSAFAKLEVPQPSESEQTAIAAVLSDMDAEIAELETRRDKTRALKQGMMQELLTGRIRLV